MLKKISADVIGTKPDSGKIDCNHARVKLCHYITSTVIINNHKINNNAYTEHLDCR